MNTLEKELLHSARGLPKESLKEVIAFIHLLKNQKNANNPADNIAAALRKLNHSQITHLEEEVENYQKLYPRE